MLRIILVGKIKEKYASEALNEYSKRLKRYANLDIVYLKNEDEIEKYTSGKLFVLDEKGRQFDSVSFSKILLDRNITFCIGPADGFTDNFLKNKSKISLSQLTLMHQLALVVLLEQIYRGFTILNNEPYHRE